MLRHKETRGICDAQGPAEHAQCPSNKCLGVELPHDTCRVDRYLCEFRSRTFDCPQEIPRNWLQAAKSYNKALQEIEDVI